MPSEVMSCSSTTRIHTLNRLPSVPVMCGVCVSVPVLMQSTPRLHYRLLTLCPAAY